MIYNFKTKIEKTIMMNLKVKKDKIMSKKKKNQKNIMIVNHLQITKMINKIMKINRHYLIANRRKIKMKDRIILLIIIIEWI